jgi:hypothetical protein
MFLVMRERLMQNPIRNKRSNKTLTAKDLMKITKHVRDYQVLLTVLQDHPSIDFEAVEVSGYRV